MTEHYINSSELSEKAATLHAFDRVFLSGTIYTARDAAHKKMMRLINDGETPPFPIDGATIYYAGPTPAPQGLAIGSCGPTTSGRMDVYTPKLLDMGLACMIGKGQRNDMVVDAIVRNRAIYLCAVGGAGALACKSIKSCSVVAFEELGCESIKKLEIENFPLIVAVDSTGSDIFKEGRRIYLKDMARELG